MKVSARPESLNRRFPDGVFPAGCPSRVLLDHVTSKWGVLILHLAVGAARTDGASYADEQRE